MIAWQKVHECLDRLAEYRPEHHDDFDAASPSALSAARRYARRTEELGDRLPDDVFLMPDGGVMMLWVEGETKRYIDLDPAGVCQQMTTFGDGRPAEFADIPEVT